METFIRVAEIWVPTRDRRQVELGCGLYGPLEAFRDVSAATRFAYDEGLPGKAWAARHPIILKDLVGSYFKRGEAAREAGLTCVVALPVFAGDFLMAVMVLLCGDDAEHVGAIELWTNDGGATEMGLVDGYYGTAETFEWASRRSRFVRGMGLPGMVSERAAPVVMEDLGRARRFLRFESAQRVGINQGIGIPCGRQGDQHWVMTLLSALGTPIARRFEVWRPDERRDGLVFQAGICEADTDLAGRYAACTLARGAGTLGHVWRSGAPAIATELADERQLVWQGRDAGFHALVALPIIATGRLDAIVAWYL